MPYTAEVTRATPTCFLFLIDQSGSMQDVLDPTDLKPLDKPLIVDGRTYTHTAGGRSKARGVADAVNKLLSNMVLSKCAKEDGIRDYFHVGVVGYGTNVGSCFGGKLAGRELVPISEIANNPMRVDTRTRKIEDGAGGLVDQQIKFPIWFDPAYDGGTPMEAAFNQAEKILTGWIGQHPHSFPPIVINITDGEPDKDTNPAAAAARLCNLATSDGQVLLFNIHISTQKSAVIEFPDSEAQLPDQFSKQLFSMSSLMPASLRALAQKDGYRFTENTRGFAFNADMAALVRFLDIGTRAGNAPQERGLVSAPTL